MKTLRRLPIPHLITLAIAALLSLVWAMAARPQSIAGVSVARQLEQTTGILIEEDSLRWIEGNPSRSADALLHSRDVAFLGRQFPAALRDLYVARARVTSNNRLVSLHSVINLTVSAAADDFLLRTDGSRLAVASRAMNRIASVTCFDLDGQPLLPNDAWSMLQRLMARINDWQRTDRFGGVDRRSIHFADAPSALDFDFLRDGDQLSLILEFTENTGRRRVAEVNLKGADTTRGGLSISSEVRLPKRPLLWIVDSVRAVPWIGPGPIEWAEGRFFALKDNYRQLAFRVVGESEDADVIPVETAAWTPIALPAGIEIGDYEVLTWPPAEIGPLAFKQKHKDEGVWYPALPEFVPTIPGAPPSMYRTYVRPDKQRPYARVALIAMDTRQLDLHMVGGHEDPRSTTGQVGSGRIPRDPEVLTAVVAAFNGAFKTEHGGYGMMEERTVLLPPLKEAASIATWRDGRISLGAWPDPPVIPDDMVSFRQNMDPLLEDGVVNPRRRYLWGFTLGSDLSNMNTIRSGVCVRPDGILVYAWGDEVTALTLGEAMKGAGCEFGMHLDMNPLHTAFIAYGFKPTEKGRQPQYDSRILYPGMRFSTGRFINGSPKDFFYLTLRPTAPGVGWTHDDISQPRPAFLPSVFRRTDKHMNAVAINLRNVAASRLSGLPPGDTDDTATDEKSLASLLVEFLPGSSAAPLEAAQLSLSLSRTGIPVISKNNTSEGVTGTAFPIDETLQENEEKVFVAAIRGNWLFFMEGAAADVQTALRDAGVQSGQAILCDDDTVLPTVLLRTRQGVTDIRGQSITTRDARRTAIRFCAADRPLFASRMKF